MKNPSAVAWIVKVHGWRKLEKMSPQQVIIALLIAAGVAVLIYKDAKKNGYSHNATIGWALGVFMFMMVFLPAYLIVTYLILKGRNAKRPAISTPCEYCEKTYFGSPNYCPHCGHLVRRTN